MALIAGDVRRVREGSARALGAEHDDLLQNVQRRVAAVTALLEVRVWPHAELSTLVGFLRTTVLRQASDEEVLIYPPRGAGGPFAELSADHARLYALTAQLEHVRADPCPLGELRTLVDELVETLRRHLVTEHAIFEALACVDAAPSSGEDDPIAIRLAALPGQSAVQWCIERVLRLMPGQRAEILAADRRQLRAVAEWLQRFDTARFGLAYGATRGGDAVLEVSCRG